MLVVHCLRGTDIGQVKIEQMNKKYYYFYENEKCENSNFDKKGNILFIQYKDTWHKNKEIKKEKKTRECCGMAFGTYEKKEIEEYTNELLEVEVKTIKFNEEIEVSERYNDIIHNIINNDKRDLLTENSCYYISSVVDTKEKTDKLREYTEVVDGDEEFEKAQELYKEYSKNKEEFNNEKYKKVFESYDKLENNLSTLAQRSINAKRVINKGDRRENRTEYQRDWERIIHSKSFRRLEDKAQIYTLSKGDHFRTRLTHSLEVTQIARGIARELDLNEDLVEAIALGHDLGHTPFGHAGERTLNEILENEGVKGGFKHNFQGVKVVNYLEEKYGDFEGIDLTYQVMEGILKHTKVSNCKRCKKHDECEKNKCKGKALECENNIYQIGKFLCKGDTKKLHTEYTFATTLEGQVVAVADEIAQRAHDLDDGIASGIINETELIKKLRDNALFKKLSESIDKSLNYIDENKRDYIDILDIKRARIVSDVITYFISKIVKIATHNINEYIKKNRDKIVIKEELIRFEGETEDVRKELEEITSKKIINSEEVNCFDGKGEYIIRKLYKAYITNPKQMSETTRKRIKKEISKFTNAEFDIKDLYIKEDKCIKLKELDTEDINLKLRLIKHKIFVRSVIDLIAGMTDEFANKQFEKLYSPRTY